MVNKPVRILKLNLLYCQFDVFSLVFETLYIDCNLEETNSTALIVTPSTGVFEVDEELTNLTKNRLIDNGKLPFATIRLQKLICKFVYIHPLFQNRAIK